MRAREQRAATPDRCRSGRAPTLPPSRSGAAPPARGRPGPAGPESPARREGGPCRLAATSWGTLCKSGSPFPFGGWRRCPVPSATRPAGCDGLRPERTGWRALRLRRVLSPAAHVAWTGLTSSRCRRRLRRLWSVRLGWACSACRLPATAGEATKPGTAAAPKPGCKPGRRCWSRGSPRSAQWRRGHSGHAEPVMMSTKSARVKPGAKWASTSSFIVPKVVSGRSFIPS
jgi:hypothetical protein